MQGVQRNDPEKTIRRGLGWQHGGHDLHANHIILHSLCGEAGNLLAGAGMSAETLLQCLEKVRKTGQDKWSARCPAHDDKGPSLSVKEAEDGRVLLHCFAGCTALEILDAVGLSYSDLFPAKPLNGQSSKPIRKPWNATDVLNALGFEILIAWNFAKAMTNGHCLSEIDRDRLLLCATRMQRGLEAING